MGLLVLILGLYCKKNMEKRFLQKKILQKMSLDNDDLVFSIVSGYHEESPDGQGFYKLRAQSKD